MPPRHRTHRIQAQLLTWPLTVGASQQNHSGAMSCVLASDALQTCTLPARSHDESTIEVRVESFCFCRAGTASAPAASVDVALLRSCESLWRQLAPSTPEGTEAYLAAVSRVLSTEPLHLITASSAPDAAAPPASRRIVGLALVRSHANTFNIVKTTLDGIFVEAPLRGRGIGRMLVNAAKDVAARAGSLQLTAVVPTLAADAARFLLREKIIIRGMAFTGPTVVKPLTASNPSASVSPASPAASFRTVLLSSLSAPSAADLLILRAAEPVHRQLRDTQIAPGFAAYAERLKIIGEGGGRMVVVLDGDGADPSLSAAAPVALGVGVFRFYTDAVSLQLKCYVDDLVTDSTRRSMGVGAALVAAIREEAVAKGVETFQLDSGVQRTQAHKFYFRSGLVIESFACAGPLTKLKMPL